MFFSSDTPQDAMMPPPPARVPDGSKYILAAVIIPLVCLCLFGGAQFLPGDEMSWTRYLKLDPSDDTCALLNYGIVAGAAIVGMGAGMKLGGKHFPWKVIAGSLMAFSLAMMANAVYTQFKSTTANAVAKAVGADRYRHEDEEESDKKHKDYSPDEDDERDSAPDALAELAYGLHDADGPPIRTGPVIEIPVENGTYESVIEPGSCAIGQGQGDACISGCSLVNIH